VSFGAGPRASQYLVLGAKARAALQGRPSASVEDVRALAVPVLAHRVVTNFHAEASGVRAADLVRTVLESVRGRDGHAGRHRARGGARAPQELTPRSCRRSATWPSGPAPWPTAPWPACTAPATTAPRVEFAEHKEYSPGDNVRHLDWRAFARFDRDYIKRFEDEANLRAWPGRQLGLHGLPGREEPAIACRKLG
jgi:hypothetical protein